MTITELEAGFWKMYKERQRRKWPMPAKLIVTSKRLYRDCQQTAIVTDNVLFSADRENKIYIGTIPIELNTTDKTFPFFFSVETNKEERTPWR